MSDGLRDYQMLALTLLRQAWIGGRRGLLLVLPTGAGKTRVCVALIRSGCDKGTRVLVLAHRKELIEQAAAALRLEGVTPAILAPWAPSAEAQVTVGSIDLLKSRGVLPDADLVVLDECHHGCAPGNFDVLDYYRKAGKTLIGLTATPEREDGVALGNVFDAMIAPAKYSELIAKGWLVPARVVGPQRKAKTLYDDPLSDYQKRAAGRQGIVFCASIAGGQELCARANAIGIPSGWVDGTTPADERTRVVDAFKAERLRLMMNYAVFTEGFDCPSTSWIGIARGFSSTMAFLQATGRGLRIAPGKTHCLVSDFMGVTNLHGLPHADRVYSLTGRAIQLAPDGKEQSMLQCPGCLTFYLGPEFETSVCPWCGYEKKGRQDPKVRAAIVAQIMGAHPDTKRTEQLRSLIAIAVQKGYKLGWVRKQFEIRYKHYPTDAMLSAAGYWVAQHAAKRKGT